MNPFYIHSKPEKGLRRVTVAAIIKGNTMHFGVSRCSHKDRFVKSIGRNLSVKRAANMPCLVTTLPSDGKYGKFFSEEGRKLIQQAQKNNELPKSGRSLFVRAIEGLKTLFN